MKAYSHDQRWLRLPTHDTFDIPSIFLYLFMPLFFLYFVPSTEKRFYCSSNRKKTYFAFYLLFFSALLQIRNQKRSYLVMSNNDPKQILIPLLIHAQNVSLALPKLTLKARLIACRDTPKISCRYGIY